MISSRAVSFRKFIACFSGAFTRRARSRSANLHQRDTLSLTVMPARSELEFKRELDIALATASRAASLGGDFSEGRACRIELHAAAASATPIGMVPDVKRFGAELKPDLLADRDYLEQAEVPVLESGLVNDVAHALRVERPGGRFGKDRRVEPLAVLAKSADDLGRAAHHPVLTIRAAPEVRVQADPGVVRSPGNAARGAGLELRDAADLPSTERPGRETRLLATVERKLVEVIENKDVVDVELHNMCAS